MKRLKCLLPLLPLLLTGCISGAGVVTTTNLAGEVVEKTTDAAVARDNSYNKARIARDESTEKMYKLSGVNLKMKFVEVAPGVFVHVMEELTIRSPHKYQQDLALSPPDHRGWDTADKAIDTVWKGLGLFYITDAFKALSNNSTPKYYGDYNEHSNNPVTTTEIPYKIQ